MKSNFNTVDEQLIATSLSEHVATIPDYPQTGVLFRDISPWLADGEAFHNTIKLLAEKYHGHVDYVVGLESRGFLLAAPLAYALHAGMVMIRKAGKLPGKVIGIDLKLEYGTARVEMNPTLLQPGAKVLIVDDVLATGGTAWAALDLLQQCQAQIVAFQVLLELSELKGRARLPNMQIESILKIK